MKNIKYFLLGLTLFAIHTLQAQDTIQVFVRANVKPGKVQLRWVVNSPQAWYYTNQNGFRVQRFTILRNGITLDQPELKELSEGIVKPHPLDDWQHIAPIDPCAAIIAQALYGKDFEVSAGKKDIGSIIALSQEQEQRYAMSMFAAELSYPAALFAGWGFEDMTVKEDEKYLYRITPVMSAKKKYIEEGNIYIGSADVHALPRPIELDALWGNQSVTLTWNYQVLENFYNAYWLERSEDGKNFSRISEMPLTNIGGTERIYYTDSIANNRMYHYRIQGQNTFGDLSDYSDIIQGKGQTALSYNPFITRVVPNKAGDVVVEWEFDESGNAEIQEFELRRSDTDRGKFETITRNIAPAERQTVYQKPLPENYLVIAAIPKNGGEPTLSFPHFLQMEDTIPPAVPLGLQGTIDTLGIVRLTWHPNSEPDFYGYRIYRGQTKNEELTPLNNIAFPQNEFTDTIQLKNLNHKVYYAVTSLDRRYNQSALSPVVELEKPDLIPPTPPLITKAEPADRGIRLEWATGNNENIGSLKIFRDKELLKEIVTPGTSTYTDEKVEAGTVYSYEVVSINRSGMASQSSPPMPVKAKEKITDGSGKITEFKANKSEDRIVLHWKKSIDTIRSISLYKKEGEQPMMLLRELDISTSEFTDVAVKPNCAYEYLLVIKNQAGIPANAMVKINY